MSTLLYGFFACYAVTAKCDLRVDTKGRDMAVFASLEECQSFGSVAAKAAPDKDGRWSLDEGHYYECLALRPVVMSAAPAAAAARPVYKTTAEALQRDFQTNPDALNGKIGGAVLEVTGIIDSPAVAEGKALQLSGDTWDVTAWLSAEGSGDARGLAPHSRVTLRCERIGTLVAAAGRRPRVVELQDCKLARPEG